MSDITNTEDIIDVRDIIARVEELREQRKMRIVAGWNMPGYLPDSEPAEFDDWDDARSYIADSMREEAEDEESDAANDDVLGASQEAVNEAGRELREAADALESSTKDEDYGNTIGKSHFWITAEGTMGLDEEETAELAQLESLLEDLRGSGGEEQWEGSWYPITLVRDSYWKDYAQQTAEDLGAIPSDAAWPCTCIDWDQAARELRMDYSSVEFDDVTYWYR